MLIPLQATASQGGFAFLEGATDFMHLVLHEGNTGHHHDENGHVHFNDSPESAKHQSEHAACMCHPFVLPSVKLPEVILSVLTKVYPQPVWYLPDPYPDHPQRPPQTHSS